MDSENKESKRVFQKYYKRVAHEGMLRAAFIGLIVGFAVDIVFCFVTMFFSGFSLWFLCGLGAGIVCGLIVALALYYKAYKPTAKSIARRVDRLGLEERMITMTELENDPSYIAMRQREDATQKLEAIEVSAIRFEFGRPLILSVLLIGFVCLLLTVLNALTGFGIIDWSRLFPRKLLPTDYVVATYLVSGEGEIEGLSVQENILKGSDAETVIAVSESGWAFVGWSDGVRLPERRDVGLMTDLTVTAVFEEVEGFGYDEQEDEPDDLPPEEGDSQGGGDPTQSGDQSSGSEYDPANGIIDGVTPYMNDFEEWYEKAVQELLEDGELTPETRAMIEAYFEALKAGADFQE